jgi:hypothetical protein
MFIITSSPASRSGTVPSDILMAIVLLSMGSFACRAPASASPTSAMRRGGVPPPSSLLSRLSPSAARSILRRRSTHQDVELPYLIACIIVSSILGMDRHVLIKGFLKTVPLGVS